MSALPCNFYGLKGNLLGVRAAPFFQKNEFYFFFIQFSSTSYSICPPLKKTKKMEFQIRSDSGETKFFPTFEGAFRYYQQNQNVWKISWDDQNRWRPKYRSDRWLPVTEEKLMSLSKEYANTPRDSPEVFWVRQLVLPDNHEAIMSRKDLTPSKKEILCRVECIKEVLTEKQFHETFRNLGKLLPRSPRKEHTRVKRKSISDFQAHQEQCSTPDEKSPA